MSTDNNPMFEIKEIPYKDAVSFLLPRHYSGRKPQIKIAFGLYKNGSLVKVCTFGKPASNALCEGVCGKEYKDKVYELNRLCSIDSEYPLSKFVSKCLKQLFKFDWIIVSYSDTEMGHHGFIYQATNWIYTGLTKSRTDKYTEGNKHSRHYDKNEVQKFRKVRSSKHRYVFFCTKNRSIKKSLKYNVEEYPKGDNNKYVLGDFLKPKVISV